MTLLFEMYGGVPGPAWLSYRGSLAFSEAWARECCAGGLQVVALDRFERGVSTADLSKQIRFGTGASITGDERDIHAFCRGTMWTMGELLVLRRSFVIAMERALGSRVASGRYLPGKPKVRGRLLLAFEDVSSFEVQYPAHDGIYCILEEVLAIFDSHPLGQRAEGMTVNEVAQYSRQLFDSDPTRLDFRNATVVRSAVGELLEIHGLLRRTVEGEEDGDDCHYKSVHDSAVRRTWASRPPT